MKCTLAKTKMGVSRKFVRVSNSMQIVSPSRALLKNTQQAYAINTLYFNTDTILKSADEDDLYLQEFIDDFCRESPKYYNLREISINAPGAIMTGEMLKQLTSVKSTYTELELKIFAFHTSCHNMWSPHSSKLKKVTIRFVDGIAFPSSGTDILQGLQDLKSLERLVVENYSPHIPDIVFPSRAVKNKASRTTGFKVQ